MKMLPWLLIAAGASIMLRPKMAQAQTLQPLPATTTLPRLSESDCVIRGGIWTGTECLGAKSLAQMEQEKAERRLRLAREATEKAEYLEDRRRIITDSIRRVPVNSEERRRRTVLL